MSAATAWDQYGARDAAISSSGSQRYKKLKVDQQRKEDLHAAIKMGIEMGSESFVDLGMSSIQEALTRGKARYTEDEARSPYVWMMLYADIPAESKKHEIEEAMHVHLRDAGDGVLQLEPPFLGLSLILKEALPQLQRNAGIHTAYLEPFEVARQKPKKHIKDRNNKFAWPLAWSMLVMDDFKTAGRSVNYGTDEFNTAYCVKLLRDLLTMSVTGTRILKSIPSSQVDYNPAEIKNMAQKLMSCMTGRITEDDFCEFCAKKLDSGQLRPFEKALYASLEASTVEAIMTEADSEVIQDFWKFVDSAQAQNKVSVEEIKRKSAAIDTLFVNLGQRAGVPIEKGVYAAQVSVWTDYTANCRAVYYSPWDVNDDIKTLEGDLRELGHKPFRKRR